MCTSQPRVTQQKHGETADLEPEDLHSSIAGSAQPCNLSQVMAPSLEANVFSFGKWGK